MGFNSAFKGLKFLEWKFRKAATKGGCWPRHICLSAWSLI